MNDTTTGAGLEPTSARDRSIFSSGFAARAALAALAAAAIVAAVMAFGGRADASNPPPAESPAPSQPADEPTPTPAPSDDEEPEAVVVDGVIVIVDGVAISGPGLSVRDALDGAGGDPVLVKGVLVQDADGQIFLATAVEVDGGTARMAGPNLSVENYPADAPTFDPEHADVTGLQQAGGLSFIQDSLVYGVVTAAE